jgi:REP element-mobilizing transposase RayT
MTKPRIDFEGAWHHVMNRGIRRSPIFETASDGHLFLEFVGEQVLRTGMEVHAYCLMDNHFHLLVRSATGELSSLMQQLGSNYARAFNIRHRYDGPLFRGRFHSKIVGSDAYLSAVSRYIHRNPLDVRPPVALDRYRWSSYGPHLGMAAAPDWLTTSFLWQLHGATASQFRAHVEGAPITLSASELCDLSSIALAEQHPDPTYETVRLDRVIATALVDEVPAARAQDLLVHLGYPTRGALRQGRRRARAKVATSPFASAAIARTLDTAA